MEAVMAVCERHGLVLIEDCAHTMGARWNGVRSGNHGRVACFSAQTYKHINSGEGGLLTTNDPELAARAIVHSGSYMLYGRHGAAPDEEVFAKVRLDSANLSARLDNLRAALLRPQLASIDENIARWNERYGVLEQGLRRSPHLRLPERRQHEAFVGSSIQMQTPTLEREAIPRFVAACADRGVELKWFGDDEPKAFTSRYDSWRYLGDLPELPQTLAVLARTLDMRIPLTFTEEDCAEIAEIVVDVLKGF
jgi:dTDP-4-amino-4,6-dideoxygalactose transaminase